MLGKYIKHAVCAGRHRCWLVHIAYAFVKSVYDSCDFGAECSPRVSNRAAHGIACIPRRHPCQRLHHSSRGRFCPVHLCVMSRVLSLQSFPSCSCSVRHSHCSATCTMCSCLHSTALTCIINCSQGHNLKARALRNCPEQLLGCEPAVY